jgi:hypothetical protein
MSWLVPSALGIAAAAAAIVVALHFIARSRPLAEPLPTARFVPERPIHARTRSLALTDLLLLLMRVVAVLLIGAAIAGPVLGSNGRVARVFVLDRSRAVANVAEVRDSVRALVGANDIVLAFDSSAARVDVLDSLSRVDVHGSLSTALAAGTRAAVALASSADSVELVLVSALAREEIDNATARLRASWPGRIRVIPVSAVADARTSPRVEVRAPANDGVAAGLALMGVTSNAGTVRVVRGPLTSDDSAWASTSGHVVIHWPAHDEETGWQRREPIDAIGGVVAGAAAVVARFPRLWILQGNAVARWSDGEPAAVEHAVGAGCIRDVAILLDDASDLALRMPFRRFASELLAPCGGARNPAPIDSTMRIALAGPPALAASVALRDLASETSRWTPWLLAIASLLLIAELAVRRTERRLA